MEDEDLIVLGSQVETPAAGGDTSQSAALPVDGQPAGGEGEAAAPGNGSAEAAAPEAPEGTKPEGQPPEEQPRPGKRTGIQRMQERIARLQAENEALRSAPQSAGGGDRAAAIEKEIGPAPKETDYTDFIEYERALRQYDIRHALAEQRAADREANTSRSRNAAREAAVEAFQDRMDEARERITDFDQVLASAKHPVAPHLTELVVESEKGALLTYYLAKNPAKLAELNGMSPLQAAKAVGALEGRLTLAKPNTATRAPAPARPVTGAAAPGPDPSKMSFAEYEAWRKGGSKR